MNPIAGLKWSAAFFGVFWTVGMVWLRGAYDPAYIVVTAIGGSIAGYLWYLVMRWIFLLRHIPSEKPSGWLSRRHPCAVLSMLICRRGDIAGE
jgi:hypothetical protein